MVTCTNAVAQHADSSGVVSPRLTCLKHSCHICKKTFISYSLIGLNGSIILIAGKSMMALVMTNNIPSVN